MPKLGRHLRAPIRMVLEVLSHPKCYPMIVTLNILVIDDKYTTGLYQLLHHTYDVDQSMFCVRTQSKKKIITILIFMQFSGKDHYDYALYKCIAVY